MQKDMDVVLMEARTRLAAALIQSQSVDLTNVQWEGAGIEGRPPLTTLRVAVDKLLVTLGLLSH